VGLLRPAPACVAKAIGCCCCCCCRLPVVVRQCLQPACLAHHWLEVSVLLGELPDSYRSKRQAQQQGVDLCFCYANPIPGAAAGWLLPAPLPLASIPQPARLRAVQSATEVARAPLAGCSRVMAAVRGLAMSQLQQEGGGAKC
jgi:hypothetical protein